MTSTSLFHWLYLATTFAVTMSVQAENKGHLMNVTFYQESNSGRLVDIYATQGSLSRLQCARACVASVHCVAFRSDRSTMSCDFYRNGESEVPAPGVQLMWIQVTDVLHIVHVNGGDLLYYFYLSSVPKSYDDAHDHCNDLGGHFLEFDSLDEYDAVMQVSKRHTEDKSYVGANDIDGAWETATSCDLLDPSLWLWVDGQPDDDGGQDCAVLVHEQMLMADENCDNAFTFLCEIEE